MIVEVDELRKELVPLLGRLVGEAVGPLPQSGLDESFCLSVGPGGIRSGGEVARIEVVARVGKKL